MLEPGDAVDRLLVAGRVLVSLSSGGKYLRGWSLKDGTLLWEAVTYTAAAPSVEAAKERGADRGVDLLPLGRDADGDGAEDVLVLARGEVQMRSLSDGVIAWTAEAATRCDDERGDAGDDVARFNRLAVVGADDSIVAVGATAERGHPVAAEIDPTSGAIRRVAIATGVQGLDAISKMTVSATDAKEGVAVFGAARDAGAGADEAPTKLFALDLGKLLALAGSRGAGKDVASVFAVPTALELGAPGGTIKLEPVRGADGAGDVAAARAGAALASGSESCALIAMDPVADGSASRKPADRMRALASWPLDSSGACPAAVSPAALLDRADTKQASKTAPAARRASLRVAAVVADAAENAFVAKSFSLEPGVEASPLVFPNENLPLTPLERGAAAACWLAVDPKDGALSLLAATADASLSLRGADVAWTRDESVALAGEVLFARLPPPKSAAAAAADDSRVRPSFRESLQTQILAAKARFKRATKAELAELTAQRRSRGDKLLPTRDANGFRRQILFLSPDGALVSLHNGDGRQLWRTFLGGGVDAAGDPADAYRYAVLLPWRDGDDDEDEHALILGTADAVSDEDDVAQSRARKTRAVIVDVYTGRITSDVVLPFEAAHVLPLPGAHEHEKGEEAHEPSAMLLVDAHAPKAHVFPDTPHAARAARLDAKRVSFFTVDQENNEVRGYALVRPSETDDETDEGSDPRLYRAAQTWATKFPRELGSIVGFASKPANEPTFAWTRVLGDRSTLFKYLSPNVIFVAVAPTHMSHVSDEASAVSAHLLDAATGRVLYRVRHPEARGPVHAVVCENWVVYHYFNQRAGRFSMSVLELFDDSEHRKGVAAGELMVAALTGAADANRETVSSFAPPPLRVMGQSYFVRQSASILVATYSKMGVTAHQVLMGTGTDQVLALDKRFLDPRRPTKPTREDREEGLVPYAEVLPIAPKAWVTTKHQVARLRGIVTAPASLESTVLCVAHGLDVFFTRLHPSRSYDMLDEEFSYLLLIVTLAALAVGALSTQGMVLAKDLDRHWK